MSNTGVIAGVCLVIFVLMLCILCLCAILGASIYLIAEESSLDQTSSWENSPPSATPEVLRPTLQSTPRAKGTPGSLDTPDDTLSNTELQIALAPTDTLTLLTSVEVPINNLPDLVRRLEGKGDIPPTVEPPASPYKVGDKKSFWASNTDTNENFQVRATLRFVTDHAYFWIQDEVDYDKNDLQSLAEAFEEKIYPTNREFFGSEWTPGVDGDPHIYILLAQGLGNSIAGYFSSNDEYPPGINEYSNTHEMFLFSADNVNLSEEFTYGVLAHEFQHMIHWYRDRNEESWVNEGFSELATLLNRYNPGGFDGLFALDPDLQLNDWPTDHDITGPHYGASFLFMTYFLDRFGEEATQALVAHPQNGLTSIDAVLQETGETDPLTGQAIGADELFIDWTLANYLQDEDVGDGRYLYRNYSDAPSFGDTETISSCRSDPETRDVRQYAADYIRIACDGQTTLHFEGSTQVGVLPADPYSGSYAFWSNKGDESDMTLTRTFDFTDHNSPLTLNFRTWYDIEKDYDYLYLLASTDGERWEIVHTPSGTGEDPTGANFGWAYNGLSGVPGGEDGEAQWIRENVDISQFAGQEVQLRFEYVTDAAVNGEGFMVDDIAIPEIDYATDFESDDGGWEAAGFVRIQNALPQTYRLALIMEGDSTTVEYLTLSADNSLEIPLDFDNGVSEVVLVVTGTTRYTRQPTGYRFYFTP